MNAGKDQIVACPHCQGLAKYGTARSGNGLEARSWTDGRQIDPMSPSPPPVVACRHCAQPYWLSEAKEIGRILIDVEKEKQAAPDWRTVEYVVEAPEGGYYKVLKVKLAQDRALEKVWRTFVWWRGNDADRDLAPGEEGIETAYPEEYRDNLAALTPLFNTKNINERIMQAEATRQLGEFAEALKILDSIQGQGYDLIVRQIRTLCEQEDTTVREISDRP